MRQGKKHNFLKFFIFSRNNEFWIICFFILFKFSSSEEECNKNNKNIRNSSINKTNKKTRRSRSKSLNNTNNNKDNEVDESIRGLKITGLPSRNISTFQVFFHFSYHPSSNISFSLSSRSKYKGDFIR